MKFFMAMNPPTTTHQQKAVRILNGKPVFYEPVKLKEARRILTGHLLAHKPRVRMTGALRLKAVWCFFSEAHINGEWKTTKPDTDNLNKLLKDCMTACDFWEDDAQVVYEEIQKFWTDEVPGIYIEVENI